MTEYTSQSVYNEIYDRCIDFGISSQIASIEADKGYRDFANGDFFGDPSNMVEKRIESARLRAFYRVG